MMSRKFYIMLLCSIIFIFSISAMVACAFTTKKQPIQKDNGADTVKGDKAKGQLIMVLEKDGAGKGRKLDLTSLKDDFRKNGIPGGNKDTSISLIQFNRSDGGVFFSDLEGNLLRPCGRLVDGKILPIELLSGKVLPVCDFLKKVSIPLNFRKTTPYCNYEKEGNKCYYVCYTFKSSIQGDWIPVQISKTSVNPENCN